MSWCDKTKRKQGKAPAAEEGHGGVGARARGDCAVKQMQDVMTCTTTLYNRYVDGIVHWAAKPARIGVEQMKKTGMAKDSLRKGNI